ncbi:hypothetical protein NC868_04575, partial [Pseudomonas aeruginosa]|nr:hypothetical protein [Pseudomonas aeruginosa]
MVSVRCWQATPRIAVVSLEVEERRPGLFPWRAVGNQSRRSRQSAVPAAGPSAARPPHAAAPRHGQMARAAACYALAGSSAPTDGTAA